MYSCEPGRGPGSAIPTDSGDMCYQSHDNCYVKCGSDRLCIRRCDRQLRGELTALPNDPRQWPIPPRAGTEEDSRDYRDYALKYFGATEALGTTYNEIQRGPSRRVQ